MKNFKENSRSLENGLQSLFLRFVVMAMLTQFAHNEGFLHFLGNIVLERNRILHLYFGVEKKGYGKAYCLLSY